MGEENLSDAPTGQEFDTREELLTKGHKTLTDVAKFIGVTVQTLITPLKNEGLHKRANSSKKPPLYSPEEIEKNKRNL